MSTYISKEHLINYYNVLFGPYADVSYEVLKELQPSELKAAYRKKVFETHPDRSKILGRDEDKMNREFIRAATAYEKLISIIKDKNKHVFNEKRDVKESRAKYYNTKDVFPDRYYKGSMPKRKLLLGQFFILLRSYFLEDADQCNILAKKTTPPYWADCPVMGDAVIF